MQDFLPGLTNFKGFTAYTGDMDSMTFSCAIMKGVADCMAKYKLICQITSVKCLKYRILIKK